jgi:hypothetical protein
VGDFRYFAGDFDVVFVGGGGFLVFKEGAVHHHTGKAQANRLHADGRGGAVVLMHADRDIGVGFDRRRNEVRKERLTGVFARTGRGLQDHGAAGFCGRFHDRLNLFEVVHVERGNAVAVFGGVVKQLSQRDECHWEPP